MRLTALSLALAILAYTPTNAQNAAAGGLGAISAILFGAIAGGLNGGGATVTVPVTVTVPAQQTPGNGNGPLPTMPPGQGQQKPPLPSPLPGQQQPPIMPGMNPQQPGQQKPGQQPGGGNQRQPSPLPTPGAGGGNQRQNPSLLPGQPGQNPGGANPTPRPLPGQNLPGQNNPAPTPGMGMGGLPGQAMGTGRLGAEFPVFTGPARISMMVQRVQSIESVAATATGPEQIALVASASVMRDEAEKAMASATMGAMDMEAEMKKGGAEQLRGSGVLVGLVFGGLGVGMVLL